jgi:hypothetical protein
MAIKFVVWAARWLTRSPLLRNRGRMGVFMVLLQLRYTKCRVGVEQCVVRKGEKAERLAGTSEFDSLPKAYMYMDASSEP